jgi:two-component system NtrC family sensor kinase
MITPTSATESGVDFLVFSGKVKLLENREIELLASHGFYVWQRSAGSQVFAILATLDTELDCADVIEKHFLFPEAEVVILEPPKESRLLQRVVNEIPGLRFGSFGLTVELTLELSIELWIELLKSLRVEIQIRRRQSDLRKLATLRYKELRELNENLEKLVEERTLHLQYSHSEEKKKLKQERVLIQFMLEMQRTVDLDDAFFHLRKQIIGRENVFDLFMVHTSRDRSRLRYVDQGRVKVVPIEIPTHILGSTTELPNSEQTKLARILSRPLNRILRLSLIDSTESIEVWIEILTDFSEIEAAEAFGETLRISKLVIDRILNDESVAIATHRWAQIFDGLQDAIAIVDKDFQVIRANTQFHKKNESRLCFESFAGRSSPCVGCPLPARVAQTKGSETVPAQIQVGEKVYLVRSESVGAFRYVHHYEDVTESRMLYARLIQTEKLGALGALAGQVAHELNNPLSGIRNLSQVIRSECQPEDQIHKDLLEVEKAAQRCQNIIFQLLEFSKEEGPQSVVCTLDEVIQKTIPLLKTAMRNHRIHIDLQAATASLLVEPQLIQQVIFNLVQNACQAMEKAGQLTIRTRIDVDAQVAEFQIQDSGPGIPASVQSRLFEAFYTTKKTSEGTGLGLYLSRKILERFKGSLNFETGSHGTTFIGRLPLQSVL